MLVQLVIRSFFKYLLHHEIHQNLQIHQEASTAGPAGQKEMLLVNFNLLLHQSRSTIIFKFIKKHLVLVQLPIQ